MNRAFSKAGFVILLTVFVTAPSAYSAAVNFQGFLHGPGGSPVVGGRVIAGTFKPGFNVDNYACTYGDLFCNLNNNFNYDHAVADGNFIPLNSGVLTDFFGSFSGSGISSATGSQIWIYGFPGPEPVQFNLLQALATSSDASFFVPAAGATTVNASLTNHFVLGQHINNGIGLSVVPFPEPSSILLCLASIFATQLRRQRRNC